MDPQDEQFSFEARSVPDDFEQIQEDFQEYFDGLASKPNEASKSEWFRHFLHELYGDVDYSLIERAVEGLEQHVRRTEGAFVIQGFVDDLFGNLLFEFKDDLDQDREDAEDQIKKYVAALWSQEPPGERRNYIGLATDGDHFVTYTPALSVEGNEEVNPEDVQLNVIDDLFISNLSPLRAYFWLDRYVRRQEIRPPKPAPIVEDFGAQSHAFQAVNHRLRSLWDRVQEIPSFEVVYDNWRNYLRIVYGTRVEDGKDLFCRHTYLATVAKLMVWQRLVDGGESPTDETIKGVLEGSYFQDFGLNNFLEEDFFSWLVRSDVREEGMNLARQLLSLLEDYRLSDLSEDVLKALYQQLVDPKERHDLGVFSQGYGHKRSGCLRVAATTNYAASNAG